MIYAWYDILGTVGVAVIILTYVLLQLGKVRNEALSYSVLNCLGAGLIVISLIFSFNFAAFVVESLWVVISLYGIARYFFKS